MAVLSVFIVSLFINAIISSLFGLAGLLLGYNFLIGFLLSLGSLYVIGWLFNIWVEQRLKTESEKIILLQNLEELTSNSDLHCAYCNSKNHVRILLNQDNEFRCLNCQERNKVQINLATMRVTEPVYADDALKNIFEQLEQKKVL